MERTDLTPVTALTCACVVVERQNMAFRVC